METNDGGVFHFVGAVGAGDVLDEGLDVDIITIALAKKNASNISGEAAYPNEVNKLPAPPVTGTALLQSSSGVLEWLVIPDDSFILIGKKTI